MGNFEFKIKIYKFKMDFFSEFLMKPFRTSSGDFRISNERLIFETTKSGGVGIISFIKVIINIVEI